MNADLTAPFVCFEDSTQLADIQTSKGPTGTWRGYARWKQYNKDGEIGRAYRAGDDLRGLEFDQPFQWALDWLRSAMPFSIYWVSESGEVTAE